MHLIDVSILTCTTSRFNDVNKHSTFYCIVSLKYCLVFYRNIEDILAQKGESVKRLSESDSLEFLVQNLVDKIEKEKQVDDDQEKS